MNTLLVNFFNLFVESAPWLLLGLFIAGLMKALIPQQWMEKQLGGDSLWHVVKAAFIGAPLPLCSCGVIPAAMSLKRSGASNKSTVSFLVATPETGADSISLSYVLLGPFMAIARPVSAILSAIVAGALVPSKSKAVSDGQKVSDGQNLSAGQVNSSGQATSCCSSKTFSTEAAEPEALSACSSKSELTSESTSEKSCCASRSASIEKSTHIDKKNAMLLDAIAGVRYSFTQLLKDISFWLLIGLAVAAVMQTFIPADFFMAYSDSVMIMVLMAIIGIPMYICASASTPLAAGLLASGLSPGAILVFMLAGPATNIGSLGIIKKELGSHALVSYLIGVIGTALFCGYAANYLLDVYPQWMSVSEQGAHEHGFGSLDYILSAFLLAMMVFNYLPKMASLMPKNLIER